MNATELHNDTIVIDGLIIANWSREIFEQMHQGGLTMANCTCAVWEGTEQTLANISQWKRWFTEHDDLITQVHSVADIRRAKSEGRVGITLGWQNTYAIETDIDMLRVFRDLGVRFMQLTYNTQNLVGSGCWESEDRGLSDYGRDVVDMMSELGIVADLSHVGEKTAADAIAHSKTPICFTHAVPKGLKDNPRNKSDALIKTCVDNGGFFGFATYGPFLPWGDDTTVENCVEALEYGLDLVGEDALGIGTDFTQGHDADFFTWLRSDKGTGRTLITGFPGRPKNPKGLDGPAEYPNMTNAMLARGWPEDRVRKVMGGNWLAYLERVWEA
ncbi:MAG: membrane dipeptidase [Rhodospirillaceae bacterium]|nr:membrane dipeptidase [Rhodospirillaceae bacterium]